MGNCPFLEVRQRSEAVYWFLFPAIVGPPKLAAQPQTDAWGSPKSSYSKINLAAFSPIIIAVPFVLPRTIAGIMDASATRRPITP